MGRWVMITTLGCHLCEQMAALVKTLSVEDIAIDSVEISDDEALLERFAERIPVLIDETRPDDVLEGRVDADSVARWLDARGLLDHSAWRALVQQTEAGEADHVVGARLVRGRRVFGGR